MAIKVYSDRRRFAALAPLARDNPKTGPMAQLAVMPWAHPCVAVRTGSDVSVCGTCPLRQTEAGVCYVVPIHQIGMWRSAKSKPVVEHGLPDGKPVRLGSWGDPAFLPLSLLQSLTAGRRHTGYTHQWEDCPSGYSSLLMASVDGYMAERASVSISELRSLARSKGYRTFRLLAPGEPMESDEVACPFETKGVQCIDCGLCNGAGGAKSITIPAHGFRSGNYVPVATLEN